MTWPARAFFSLSWACRAAAFPFAFLVLAARCLAPRPVALIGQATLAGFLALRRVGHRMVVVRGVHPPPPGLDGFFRWLRRDQTIAPVSNQVLPPGLDECLPHGKPVLRLEKLHQCPLH